MPEFTVFVIGPPNGDVKAPAKFVRKVTVVAADRAEAAQLAVAK